MSLHSEVRRDHQKHAERYVRRANGGAISDKKQDEKMVAEGVHEHEDHLHPGAKKTKLRLRRGGDVHGKTPAERLDKRARGGGVSKGKHKTNIIIHAGGDTQQAHQQGMQEGAALGARAAAAKMAGGAPGGPGAMAGPRPPGPPGMPPGPPTQAMPGPRPMPNGPMPGAFKSGGKIESGVEKFGSKSGEGRLEKEGLTIPVKAHTRRRGGATC